MTNDVVAGNLIRILFRDYRDTCKVVGIADGFGVAEDPNGLDPDELLRLVTVCSCKFISFQYLNKYCICNLIQSK